MKLPHSNIPYNKKIVNCSQTHFFCSCALREKNITHTHTKHTEKPTRIETRAKQQKPVCVVCFLWVG